MDRHVGKPPRGSPDAMSCHVDDSHLPNRDTMLEEGEILEPPGTPAALGPTMPAPKDLSTQEEVGGTQSTEDLPQESQESQEKGCKRARVDHEESASGGQPLGKNGDPSPVPAAVEPGVGAEDMDFEALAQEVANKHELFIPTGYGFDEMWDAEINNVHSIWTVRSLGLRRSEARSVSKRLTGHGALVVE